MKIGNVNFSFNTNTVTLPDGTQKSVVSLVEACTTQVYPMPVTYRVNLYGQMKVGLRVLYAMTDLAIGRVNAIAPTLILYSAPREEHGDEVERNPLAPKRLGLIHTNHFQGSKFILEYNGQRLMIDRSKFADGWLQITTINSRVKLSYALPEQMDKYTAMAQLLTGSKIVLHTPVVTDVNTETGEKFTTWQLQNTATLLMAELKKIEAGEVSLKDTRDAAQFRMERASSKKAFGMGIHADIEEVDKIVAAISEGRHEKTLTVLVDGEWKKVSFAKVVQKGKRYDIVDMAGKLQPLGADLVLQPRILAQVQRLELRLVPVL